MIADNVTLIVKAPNQQIEDQNVECQTSWTVRQLKGHLSVVYPSKPKEDEQKIIYSGQLLDDNTILKDVLRNYETQIAHTMHLVCSNKKMMEQKPELPKTDGLRQRNVTETAPRPAETTSRPETRQNDQNHTVEMQNYLNSYLNNYGRVPPYPNYNLNLGQGYLPVPNDPASMANHVLMVQQAYIQYMQQYNNMRKSLAETQPTPPPVETPPQPPAEAPEAEPEDGQARDWLDHLYAASRFGILLSLFWLYGSPARLLLVVLLAAAGYLHQIGFFRDLHLNPGNNQPNQVNQPRRNQQPPDNQNDDNQNPEPTARPNNEPPNNEDDNQQSLLAVTWMIFTTFFASLVPDTNN
ncbi:homocysteine-responsive endoplasmic reticulum-resident ubiquitin-like domain member 2 protein [Maniola jurtina]|uniref:homocysteine-responsive endoplasmic reticulum-resident ubiquitin-like domain member 2 protein n=1 Tax=Maniola jurtina TaxID=191418 RepID=UPI001E688827|nr:homocysteine-responsive endoplasmic reticulum-resident ubiquitin-like domain member 2 protein [Maniola jurtina]